MTLAPPHLAAPAGAATGTATGVGGQLRLLALAALLVGEASLARRLVDTDLLVGHAHWWVEPVRALSHNVPWGACVVAVAALVGAGRWRAAFGAVAAHPPARREALLAALAHVLWAAVLFALVTLLLAGGSTLAALDAVLPLVCAAAALACAGAALFAFAPPAVWAEAFGPLRRALAAGLVVGSALYWVGAFVDGSYFLWGPLADVTLRASALGVGLFTDAVHLEPDTRILGTDRFRVIVTKYCSGLEGLTLFGLFFGSFLVLARERLRPARALLLLPVGLVLVWCFNAARIAALVALGHFVDPELAVDAFHTHAGWPPLIAVALGSVAVATRAPGFRRQAPARRAGRTSAAGGRTDATSAHLLPLLAVVATALVAGAFLSEPATAAPLRVVVGGAVLWRVRTRLWPEASWSAALDGARRWHTWACAALALAVWVALDPDAGAGSAPPAAGTAAPVLLAACFWVCAFASYAVVTPLVEELAFRGYAQRALVRARFEDVPFSRPAPLAVLGSALAFGLLHSNLAGGVLCGVLFSLAAARRGRLGDAIWAHALVNAALALLAVVTGDWGWWF